MSGQAPTAITSAGQGHIYVPRPRNGPFAPWKGLPNDVGWFMLVCKAWTYGIIWIYPVYMQIIVIIDQSPYRYTGLCLCVLSLVEVYLQRCQPKILQKWGTGLRSYPVKIDDQRNHWILEEHAFLGQT